MNRDPIVMQRRAVPVDNVDEGAEFEQAVQESLKHKEVEDALQRALQDTQEEADMYNRAVQASQREFKEQVARQQREHQLRQQQNRGESAPRITAERKQTARVAEPVVEAKKETPPARNEGPEANSILAQLLPQDQKETRYTRKEVADFTQDRSQITKKSEMKLRTDDVKNAMLVYTLYHYTPLVCCNQEGMTALSDETGFEILRKGIDAYLDTEYKQTIRLLSPIVEDSKCSLTMRMQAAMFVAQTNTKLKQHNRAVQFAKRAKSFAEEHEQKHGENAQAWLRMCDRVLAWMRNRRKDDNLAKVFQDLIDEYEEVEGLPQDPRVYLKIAQNCHNDRDNDGRIANCRMGIKIGEPLLERDPNWQPLLDELWMSLSEALFFQPHFSRNRINECLQMCLSIVERNPSISRAYETVSKMYLKLKNKPQALAWYEKILREFPDKKKYLKNLKYKLDNH